MYIIKIFLLRNNKKYLKNTDNFEFSSGMITLLLLYFNKKHFWDLTKKNQIKNMINKINFRGKHYFLIKANFEKNKDLKFI